MKVILVHIGDINYCPPALNVINSLNDLEHEVIVCTTQSKGNIKSKFTHNIQLEEINVVYEKPVSIFKKFIRMLYIKKNIWEIVNKYYDNNSIIWVVSDVSIKHIGNKLISKKYILHLMELSESLTYYHKIKFLKLNANQLGNNAYDVVVPEYNRAHIVKAWWGLDKLPSILENKPYNKVSVKKNSVITKSSYAEDIINELKDKKIILYQGIIHKERPLDKFIKAVDMLGDEYAFVVMSKGENIYKDIKSSNYYFIPFVEPPYHLEITSHAYIGVLSYFPVKSDYSILNALFCAPNKTYEYGMFGIPMISNDVPALKYLFETNNCGVCINDFSEDHIYKAILEIEGNYDEISNNSLSFYNKVNVKKAVDDILNK